MKQHQLSIRTVLEEGETLGRRCYIFQVTTEGYSIVASGRANSMRTAEARAFRACSEYFRDMQELVDSSVYYPTY